MKRFMALGLIAIGLNFFQVNHAQAQTAVVGILTVTITVILTTAIPPQGYVGCEANVQSLDNLASATLFTTNSEESVVVGVVNGGIATCTMVIPYSWNLVTPNADVINVAYGAAILPQGATLIENRISGAPPIRDGGHSFVPITGVPATGTHWALKATTRL